jgi:hypothetical protein
MECYKKVENIIQSFITPKPLKSFKSFKTDGRSISGQIMDGGDANMRGGAYFFFLATLFAADF